MGVWELPREFNGKGPIKGFEKVPNWCKARTLEKAKKKGNSM